MNVLITGGAGFIGSNLTERLIRQGHFVVCADDFTLGSRENIKSFMTCRCYQLYQQDAADAGKMAEIMKTHRIEYVFHLAANSDIQKSAADPETDLTKTFLTTYGVLEAMRRSGTKKLFFASTSAVYGEKTDVLLKEDMGSLSPISYYGGAKLASEAFISSYAYMNDFDVLVFRFPNVIGPGLTHGVIFDFIRKLSRDPENLEILGDGTQTKPYIYIDDLLEAVIQLSFRDRHGVDIYNLGVEGSTSVTRIADLVCEAMGIKNAAYRYTGSDRGWKGDVPAFQYDLSKIRAEGWRAEYTSDEAVKETLREVINGRKKYLEEGDRNE